MKIEEASRACLRGQFICQHMAILLLFAEDNISTTDVECQWSKWGVTYGDVELIENLYTVKHHRSARHLPTDAKKFFLVHWLHTLGL